MNKSLLTIIVILSAAIPSYGQNVIRDTTGIDKSACDTPSSLIVGKVSGVRVTDNTLVRGLNSLRGDSSPLWVVDGMPLGTLLSEQDKLSFLNPYDIESIEIIKDLSAAAVYGQMGANGVILINTRRNCFKEGTKVEWNSNLSVSMPYQGSDAFRTGFGQNHTVGVSHVKGRSALNISGRFVRNNGVVKRETDTYGNFDVMYETKVNPYVWFGTNLMFSVGAESSLSEMTPYGEGSLMMSALYPQQTPVSSYLEDYDNDSKRYRLVNSTFLQINFLKELNLRIDVGADYNDRTNYIWYGPLTPKGAEYNGYATIASRSLLRMFAKPTLNWNRWFGQHHIVLSGGGEFVWDKTKANRMDGYDFFSKELRAKGLNIHASQSGIQEYAQDYSSMAAFLSGSYGFGKIFGVDFLLRGNWTKRYDDSKPTPYYSVGAFVNPCPQLKLFGGYGVAGREQALPYVMFGCLLPEGYPEVDKDLDYFYEGLSRTQSKEWNVGADLNFLAGRLKASAKYYRKHSVDRFNAYCFGAKTSSYLWDWSDRTDFFSRSSEFTSSGVEIDIDALAIKTEGTEWTIGANFTYNEIVVTDVDSQDLLSKSVGGGLVSNANPVGMGVNSIVGYRTDGNGTVIDQTGDGKISEADLVVLGNPSPKFYGGLFTTVKFSGFIIDAVFDGAAGFNSVDLSALSQLEDNTHILDSYVQKGDYLRLGRISLAYDFNFGKDSFLKSLRLTLSGTNLLTVSSNKSWNPTADCYAAVGVNGLQYGPCPSARSIIAGVKLVF